MNSRYYTTDQLHFLRQNALGKTNEELTFLFNKHFRTKRTVSGIFGVKTRYGIYSGMDGWNGHRFKKGITPWNKGKSTFVARGKNAPSALPVGTERVTATGYVMVKVSYHRQPSNKNWRYKHIVIWEGVNGKLPKHFVVIFLDRDKTNLKAENLMAIPKAVKGTMNRYGLYFDDPEATKVGAQIAFLKILIRKRMRDI